MEIKLKRIYEPEEEGDGFRILVDRLYPRGIKKEDLRVDLWDKEIAPSEGLRKEFHLENNFESFSNTSMSFPKILMQQIFYNR